MIKKIELEYSPVLIIADIHGNFDFLFYKINCNKDINNCIIIIAGDVGIGFNKRTYYNDVFNKLNSLLKKRNVMCFLVRGNHDDPNYFANNLIDFSNVKTVEDYTVITVGYQNILCVGGAVSIDRVYRKSEMAKDINNLITYSHGRITYNKAKEKIHQIYWDDEMPFYDEEKLNEIIDSKIDINYVITHTSPSFCFINGKESIKHFIEIDDKLSDDLDKERETLTKIYNKLIENNAGLKEWIYGHYHIHNVDVINNVKFTALGKSDSYEFDLYTIY